MSTATHCKGCGASIRWVVTKGGKQMPVETTMTTVVTAQGEVVRGYEPHWPKCPKACDFKK